jgi:hypothetical protein
VRARINQVFLVLGISFVLSHSLNHDRYFWDPVCVKKRLRKGFLSNKEVRKLRLSISKV